MNLFYASLHPEQALEDLRSQVLDRLSFLHASCHEDERDGSNFQQLGTDTAASHHMLKLAFVVQGMDVAWLEELESKYFQAKIRHSPVSEVEDGIQRSHLPFEICSIPSPAALQATAATKTQIAADAFETPRHKRLRTDNVSSPASDVLASCPAPYAVFQPSPESPYFGIRNASRSPKVCLTGCRQFGSSCVDLLV